MGLGLIIGRPFSSLGTSLLKMESAGVNIPTAVLIWVMIFPMMLILVSIDNSSKHCFGSNDAIGD